MYPFSLIGRISVDKDLLDSHHGYIVTQWYYLAPIMATIFKGNDNTLSQRIYIIQALNDLHIFYSTIFI